MHGIDGDESYRPPLPQYHYQVNLRMKPSLMTVTANAATTNLSISGLSYLSGYQQQISVSILGQNLYINTEISKKLIPAECFLPSSLISLMEKATFFHSQEISGSCTPITRPSYKSATMNLISSFSIACYFRSGSCPVQEQKKRILMTMFQHSMMLLFETAKISKLTCLSIKLQSLFFLLQNFYYDLLNNNRIRNL